MLDDAALTCPRCNVPLKEVRTSGGILYACDRCDAGAVTIELLRKRPINQSLWLHAVQGQERIGPRCPLCRQPMIDIALRDQAEIEVDVCSHCHFVWFDAHEVEALIPRQPVRAAPELAQKARELLAIAEVELYQNRPKART
jgi:Zn-finger nucleic acid-binding protein